MESGFGDFIKQPFVGVLLGMVIFFAILLAITVASLVYVRRRRAQKNQLLVATPGFTQAETSINDADMPDLSLLVQTPVAAAPTSSPRSVTPPAPLPGRSARKGTFSITPQDGKATEAVEVLTVLRDVTDGRLIVQMGDKTYQDVSINPEFKERFNKLMRELGQAATISRPATLSNNSSVEDSEATATLANLLQTSEPAFLKPRPASPMNMPPLKEGQLPGDLPSYKLDDNPMPKLRRGQKANLEPVPEVNIAGAIETYLQHKLRQSGDFAGRSIHIYPAPDGGISIEVDGQYFEAVGDVADSGVREFLTQSIEEWQERH